jgi:UDP-glucose 6-dehydrogenase
MAACMAHKGLDVIGVDVSSHVVRAINSLAVRLAARVQKLAQQSRTVAVLGLSYKPFSNVVEESQALYLAERLVENGLRVVVYDPLAMENASRTLGQRGVGGGERAPGRWQPRHAESASDAHAGAGTREK